MEPSPEGRLGFSADNINLSRQKGGYVVKMELLEESSLAKRNKEMARQRKKKKDWAKQRTTIPVHRNITDRLRKYVDGEKYRSLAHLAGCIIIEWVESQERTVLKRKETVWTDGDPK